jgi:hypothetical protein
MDLGNLSVVFVPEADSGHCKTNGGTPRKSWRFPKRGGPLHPPRRKPEPRPAKPYPSRIKRDSRQTRRETRRMEHDP